MRQDTFFSIVTAVKDGLEFFMETAPTILGQTHKNFEWIIVDDGSTEPLEEYVNSLKDRRIRYIKNEHSLGQTRSLNRGIRESRSEWIVRVDGDDLIDPRRLELTAAAIQRGGAKPARLIFSDYDVIHEDGTFIASIRYDRNPSNAFYAYLLHKNNPLAHATVTFFKHAPDGTLYQYDENLRNAQDYALWKKIYGDYQTPFRLIAEPLLRYRLVRSSLSIARAREQAQELEAIRANDTGAASGSGAAEALSGKSLGGMYAYRVLYYRLIGHPRGKEEFSRKDDFLWMSRAMSYPTMTLKSCFYGLLRPLRGTVVRTVFKGIYD